MGAFLLAFRNQELADRKAEVKKTLGSLEAQGFRNPVRCATASLELYCFPKLNASEPQLYIKDEANFAFCAGTLLYRGKTGKEAARHLYRDARDERLDLEAAHGGYFAVVCLNGRVGYTVDRLGVYRAYKVNHGKLISSSFIALAAALSSRTINRQCVYEYVFQGATYGDETVFDEISMVPAGRVFGDPRAVLPQWPARAVEPPAQVGLEDGIDRCLKKLRTYIAQIKENYGDKVDTALSGGYDTRLLLALLLEQGITPRLHVYGRPADPDVRVALDLARGEGLSIEHIDKSKFPNPSPETFGETVRKNFLAFDGYPTDGVFEAGADLSTRRDRCRNGELMLNGGGGEIFRNFFYLPDRPYNIREFIWAFYCRFDPKTCMDQFVEHEYLERLGSKVAHTASARDGILARWQVEYLYPAFRCQYWMGRNNSLNNRFGAALTPFVDHSIVEESLRIPLKYKNFGAFAAGLIERISPKLAAYQSSYGHNFSGPPPLRRKAKELGTMLRPPLLRKYSYRLKSKARSLRPKEMPQSLTPDYLRTVIDPACPRLARYFAIDQVSDPEQLNRICTLEVVFADAPPHD